MSDLRLRDDSQKAAVYQAISSSKKELSQTPLN